ncbi:MAG: DUF1697 domain-containing protein [Oscillospiraceae bacterium]|nr:DUF1697 domain-containing protein [Oscillospiraceae bacterium]
MKRYAAFLRGINISGKNKITMPALKAELEALGFSEVSTYLNSGNAIFASDSDAAKIRAAIEAMIAEKFSMQIPVYVTEQDALTEILSHAPKWWGTGSKERYDNLIFILSDDTPENICALIGEPSEELETVQICRNVIFWTFDRNAYQKCRWWKKTASAGIAEKLTIRTAGTLRKLCAIAEKNITG